MPIIKRVPPLCTCPGKPITKGYGEGTIWECDNQECKQRWILKYYSDYNYYWEKLIRDTF